MIVFDVPLHFVLTLVAGTILPLLVGLVTTRGTSAGVKAVALAALSVAASLATELAAALQDGSEYNLGLALLTALGTFLVAVGLHYGLWKPTGVTASALDHGRTSPTYDKGGVLEPGVHHVTNTSGHPVQIYGADGKADADADAETEQSWLGNDEIDDLDGPDHRKPGPAV